MKKFVGFTPDQQFKLLSNLGYTGPNDITEMENFIKSSPGVAAKMGKYAEVAQERLNGPLEMASGGYVDTMYRESDGRFDTSTTSTSPAQTSTSTASTDTTASTKGTTQIGGFLGKLFGGDDGKITLTAPQPGTKTTSTSSKSKKRTSTTQAQDDTTQAPDPLDSVLTEDKVSGILDQSGMTLEQAISDPTKLVSAADIASVQQNPNQFIDPNTGQWLTAPQGTATTVNQVQTAQAPTDVTAAGYQAATSSNQVDQALTNVQAATADPTAKATVRGQLELLMGDFETEGTPPWASAAMRSATQMMQKRGMGASSAAGQAILTATMEAALPIAMADAKTHATFELQNLNNEQQTNLLKTQFRVQSILSDTAATNAAAQFNAASENQVAMFMSDLESRVSQFNANQVNAMMQFNAGETNAMEKFNKTLEAERDKFNAQNSLVIAQANAQWRQQIALTDTQIEHETNMEYAKQANGLTSMALDNLWQQERDLMAFAFASSESAEDRALQLTLGDKATQRSNQQGLGYILGKIVLGSFGLG